MAQNDKEQEQKKGEQEVTESGGEVKQEAVSCPNGTLYTIRRGDTFFELARRFRNRTSWRV